MANISEIVDLLHPTVSGIGIITSDQIWVLFDREIDETSVTDGNFFITGPDFDTWSGPDLQLFLDRESLGDEEQILQSPGYHGILQGNITFERISLTSLDEVTTEDTVGSGLLYRSKAIFTPTNRLQATTEYTSHLSGDEDSTDDLDTGISSRTVFDAVSSGANLGTGDVSFQGGYIGNAAEDVYRVNITTSGEVGTSRFEFSRDSDPLTTYGPFKTKRSGVLLSDGVTAIFPSGIYGVGDKWSVVVKERDIFTGNLKWPFKTGSGSIATIPDTTSTSVIGDPFPTTSTSSSTSTFSVQSTNPTDEKSNIALDANSDFSITATFNTDVNSSTVISGVSTSVIAESVTGEADVDAYGSIPVNPTVSGQVITMTVPSGILKQNNLVTVTLDSTIQSTGGTSLGSDYEFWFTTEYDPMYCTTRLINLRIGGFIQNVREDTINLAIHAASKEAESLTWNKDNLDDDYYQFVRGQWTCCRASHFLLTNTTGGAGLLKSKKLGDLEVTYNTGTDINKPLQNAEECMMRWEGALAAGGRQVQVAQGVVKGECDIDKPPIGRTWLHTRNIHHPHNPLANRRMKPANTRRFRSIFTRYTPKRGW